jgi:hypothetical protein
MSATLPIGLYARYQGLAYMRKAGALSVGSTFGLCQPADIPERGLVWRVAERWRLEHSAPSAVRPYRQPLSASHEVRS